MAYDDPEVRPLLDLEGSRQWVPGRTTGYAQLERAVDETGFYDDVGRDRPPPTYRPSTWLDLGPSGSSAARTCCSTARSRALPPGAAPRRHGTRPGAARRTCAAWCRAQGHRRRGRHDRDVVLVVVRGRRDRRPLARRGPGGRTGPGRRDAPPTRGGASPRAARSSRPAGPSLASTSTTDDVGVGRHRAAAVRAGAPRPVGSGDRDRLGRADRPAAPRSRPRSSR